MDRKEFYCLSQSFLERFIDYCFETKQTTNNMYLAKNWIVDIQDRCMRGDVKRMNRFANYIGNPSTLILKKILAEYCNDNDLIHFNAFCLIDNFSLKYKNYVQQQNNYF